MEMVVVLFAESKDAVMGSLKPEKNVMMETCLQEMVATNFAWMNLFVEMGNCSLEKSVMMVTIMMVTAVTPNVKFKEVLFVRVILVEIPSNFVEMESLNSNFPKVVTMETQTMEMVAQAHVSHRQDTPVIINFSPQFVRNVEMDNKILDKHVMMLTSSMVMVALKTAWLKIDGSVHPPSHQYVLVSQSQLSAEMVLSKSVKNVMMAT